MTEPTTPPPGRPMTAPQAVAYADQIFAAFRDAIAAGDREAAIAAIGRFTDDGYPQVEMQVWETLCKHIPAATALVATMLGGTPPPTPAAVAAKVIASAPRQDRR